MSKKAFSAEDLCLHRTVTALAGSVHHDKLAWKIGKARKGADDYVRTAWGMDGVDDAPFQLTSAEFGVASPTWNRDGSVLAFISSRGDTGPQLHLLPREAGEATRLTNAKVRLASIEDWAADGRAFLVTANCEWDEDHDPDAPRDKRSPAVVRFLPYKRDGSGITVGERTHLYRVDAETGDVEPLAEGDFDVASGAWSPDGKWLAFVRNRIERERHLDDLWLAKADGTAARRRVDSIAAIASVAWSPDGRRIAFSGSREPGDSMINLWMIDVDADTPPVLLGGEDFELEPASKIVWHPEGDRVCVICDDAGLMRIAVVQIPDGTVNVIDRGLRCVNECVAWGERLAFVSASMRNLEEVCSMDWNGGDERCHSRFNRWFRARRRPKVVRRVFDVPDGAGGTERIRAWVLRPPDREGPFPLLVDMHGGPHSNVLVDFPAHTYWYLLLEKGWAIVAPDAVGSAGYGKQFARRLRGRWGELDLPQYEAVIGILRDEGFCDDRVACAGKSYGGFLAAWAIGHTDVFRAAMVCAPVSNIESHFGTSDTGNYVVPYLMDGEATKHRARWHRQSAIESLHKSRTPALVLQGENDGRCPRGQSEEIFAHLIRYTDTPVEMVVYPTSTHSEAESGRPSNRLDYHDRIVAWAERWSSQQCVDNEDATLDATTRQEQRHHGQQTRTH